MNREQPEPPAVKLTSPGPLPQPPEDPEQLFDRKAATLMVPQALLDDLGGFDMADVLGKALRGEIQLKPSPPRRHRCLACWLVSLLPGHDRCPHGYLECEACYEP